MRVLYNHLTAIALGCYAAALTVPSSPPSNASPQLVAAPVGLSFEFFTWPGYLSTVPSTATCLGNLADLSGTSPPIRIGGTTQDRATWDPNLTQAVNYTVASPSDAPDTLRFGPGFITLAEIYGGKVTLGLNRRLNNISNTIGAAKAAVAAMPNLFAIELGNEPDLYGASSPIAGGSWSQFKDISSQVSWQASVAKELNKSSVIQAGVYLQPPTWATANLAPKEGSSLQYVASFSGHSYPQSACGGASTDLKSLMSHSGIVSYTKQYATEAAAAKKVGKPYVLGETNSATCGGGGISPTFGAGLWIVDYVFQALVNGVSELYFHQGTIGNCQYCWWGKSSMGAPYYGAYFATAALAGADKIAALDDGSSAYAAYAVYKANKPLRIVLLNTDYYTSGTRTSHSFSISGLSNGTISATRLTAPAATSRQDQGGNPSFGEQTFANGTCVLQGDAKAESITVKDGTLTASVKASEALLIHL